MDNNFEEITKTLRLIVELECEKRIREDCEGLKEEVNVVKKVIKTCWLIVNESLEREIVSRVG